MTEREKLIVMVKEIITAIETDPHLRELAETYQQKYGTMTAEELQKHFTI